jgi:hypothetical protein
VRDGVGGAKGLTDGQYELQAEGFKNCELLTGSQRHKIDGVRIARRRNRRRRVGGFRGAEAGWKSKEQ